MSMKMPNLGAYNDMQACNKLFDDNTCKYDFMVKENNSNINLRKQKVVNLSEDIVININKFCSENKLQLSVLLFSTLNILLYKYFRYENIVLGYNTDDLRVECSKANSDESLPCIMPIKTSVNDSATIIEFVNKINEIIKKNKNKCISKEFLLTRDYQDFSNQAFLEILYEYHRSESMYIDNPLFNISTENVTCGNNDKYLNCGIVFKVIEKENQIRINCQYSQNYIGTDMVNNLLQHYFNILNQFIDNSEVHIGDIELLSKVEKNKILMFNELDNYLKNNEFCIHKEFESIVSKYKDKIALIYENSRITYGELNQKATKLANFLVNKGIGAEKPVIICLPHSIELVIAILAVLKAGGICVNVDDDFPTKRKKDIIEDCDTKLIISHSMLQDEMQEFLIDTIYLDKEMDSISKRNFNCCPNSCEGTNTAFIFYTSGTTGKPKGVMHTHASRGGRLLWEIKRFQFSNNDIHLLKTSISAGVFAKELLWPLLTGATLIIANYTKRKNIGYIAELIKKYKITTMTCVPTMLKLLCMQKLFLEEDSLKQLICSGELLDSATAQIFFKYKENSKFYVAYGMNEMSTATIYTIDKNNCLNLLTIGYPAGICVYILDENLNLLPEGITGQIYVSSYGLSSGYYKRSDLTNERFIQNIIDNEMQIMYKTGDSGYYLSNGSIQYVGRVDNQIKVNGHRVELSEISNALKNCIYIQELVVTSFINKVGQNEIVAYIVPKLFSETISDDIKEYCKKNLLSYMNPLIVIMDEIPRTGAAKVDFQKLPKPIINRGNFDNEHNDPRTDLEISIAKIWKEVLEINSIRRNDIFTDLGGSSVKAVIVAVMMENKLQIQIDINDLLEKSLKEIADFYGKNGGRCKTC